MKSRSTSVFFLLAGMFFSGFQVQAQQVSPEVIRMKAAYADKAAKFLLKGDSLRDFFEIEDEGIRMYANLKNKKIRRAEFVLYWDEVDVYKSLLQTLPVDSILVMYKTKGSSRWDESFINTIPPPKPPYLPIGSRNKPLLGMKIALDPGHVGGAAEVAFIEKKMVKIHKDELNGFPADVCFNEGNLTLGTALALKQKLEDAGANVMMTRYRPGETAFGTSYDEWLKAKFPDYFMQNAVKKKIPPTDYEFWLTSATPEQIFQKFVDLKNKGLGLLIVEQNASLALEVSEKAYVLETGIITLEGTGAELLNDKRVVEAYLN